jgi:RimJ/RimL family protein N-acetyltransferase
MSKRILGDQDEQVAAWVCARVPMMELGDSPYTAIGLLDQRGYLTAGLVYSNFTRGDVHVHIAILNRRSLTRHFIREGFRYPFVQLGVRRCTVAVAASNVASVRFVKKLGFRQEGRLREWYENGDTALVFGMLRHECRWLRSPNRGKSNPRQHLALSDTGRAAADGGSAVCASHPGDAPPGTHDAARHANGSASLRRRLT